MTGLSLIFMPGATGLVTGEPGACGSCGKPHYVFVNRDGRTACLECSARPTTETETGTGAEPCIAHSAATN